jgi:uncharacterized LabA/DUF88 family protein
MITKLNKYAFIDVQNTETATLKVLGFEIDHKRLFTYLKENQGCEAVFFYPGIKYGDLDREKIFNDLSELGAVFRPKYYFTYKNKDKAVKSNCVNCNHENTITINNGYSWKCNCDVELTVDVIDHLEKSEEIFIFSGDGDFEYLIQKIIDKNIKVTVVSTNKGVNKRLSTKIKEMVRNNSLVNFIEIDNLKYLINKPEK